MRRFRHLLVLAVLGLAALAPAHLSNPSTLNIKETEPRKFEVVLTLPIIDGRVVKAKPVLPDVCVVQGEPVVRSSGSSVIRTWTMECDPSELVGMPVGVGGLLGTAQQVVLTIETLDGRKHSATLQPTQAFFVIPPPPSLFRLTLDAGREGIRRVASRPELGLLVLLAVILGLRWGALAAGIVAFAVAQALGQWLGGNNWMAVSPFLPSVLAALTALVAAMEIVRGGPVLRPGWLRPWWVVMLGFGILYGAAHPETVAALGLSRFEQGLGFFLFALGAMAGLAIMAFCARELRAAIEFLSDSGRERCIFWIGYVAGVAACALSFYLSATPVFVGGMTPAVPVVTLVACAALGLWCRTWMGTRGAGLAFCAAVFFAAGLLVSFRRVALPLDTLIVYGSVALTGAALLFARSVPLWLGAALVATAAFYHGGYAGSALRANTSLPVANAAGMMALVAFLFYACFSTFDLKSRDRTPLVVRSCGVAVLLLAIVWRLAEYRLWLAGPITSDLAMGLLRLPLLAVLLLVAAGLVWPRKRRFQVHPAGAPRVSPVMHWGLIALALFALPLGTLRVHNPFHTPRAPTATEAKHIMSTLLTDTYLAFNLPGEDEAFDSLARNISDDLVADIYLDSRRRLTAGTRQGAEVTVKDVSVMSVDEALGNAGDGNSFTYPCKWVVTARVKHWQHIHNRQNVYIGELTIRVENDRWKIAQLTLKSEERVVLPWKSS